MRFNKMFVLALLSACCMSALAEEESGVTPYRPSVSTPAQLPTPGQLEFELGGLRSKTGPAYRDSLPFLFKLAFSEQWGVLLGGEAYVSADDGAGNRTRGVGDMNVVLKRAFIIDDATALGLEFNIKAPTAKNTIGSGKTDYTVNGILSRDFGKLHMDANLNLTRLGLADPVAARTQTGWSASFSLPLSDKWGSTAELSGTHRGGAPNTAQFLAALTYSPSKRLVIDAGLARGLTNASQDWSFFTGFVVPIAKLW